LALIGSIAMLTGNTAEFWLFSDQPYGDAGNLRNASWMFFSFGSLVMDAGATLAGIALWRTKTQPRWIGALLLLALPLDLIAFFTFSPFLGPAVMAIALGWWLVKTPDQPKMSAEMLTPFS
jgi:predicted MFS family arabinose efflux permease